MTAFRITVAARNLSRRQVEVLGFSVNPERALAQLVSVLPGDPTEPLRDEARSTSGASRGIFRPAAAQGWVLGFRRFRCAPRPEFSLLPSAQPAGPQELPQALNEIRRKICLAWRCRTDWYGSSNCFNGRRALLIGDGRSDPELKIEWHLHMNRHTLSPISGVPVPPVSPASFSWLIGLSPGSASSTNHRT